MTRFNLQPGFVWGYSMIIPTDYPFVGFSHGYSIVVNHIYIIIYIYDTGFSRQNGIATQRRRFDRPGVWHSTALHGRGAKPRSLSSTP